MRVKLFIFSILYFMCMMPTNAEEHPLKKEQASEKIIIRTKNDSLSYAYGANLAQGDYKAFENFYQGEKENNQLLVDGIKRGIQADPLLSPYLLGAYLGTDMVRTSGSFAQLYYDDGKNNLNFNLVARGVFDALTEQKPAIDNAKEIMDDAYKKIQAKYDKKYVASAGVKEQSKKDESSFEESVIQTKNDSLSYAYGISLTQQKYKSFKDFYLKNKGSNYLLVDGVKMGIKANDLMSPYFFGAYLGTSMTLSSNSFAKLYYDDGKNNLNFNLVARGLSDALTGKTLAIDNSKEIMDQAYKKTRAQYEKEGKNAKNIKRNDKFLRKNENKKDIITLSNGLQFKILVQGEGKKPRVTDVVRVNYKGTLADGTEFIGSNGKEEPIYLDDIVIPGLKEAIQLMPIGSKWEVFVPYKLGYGGRKVGNIPPYSTLIFEIELLGIQ